MPLPISVGSGATLASNLLGGEHHQIISPVSIYPLPAGANFIGLATVQVSGTVGVTQSGTWNVGNTGLISLASGTRIGLNPGENYIGLASVNVGNTVTVQATDLDTRDLSSGTDSISAVQSGTWSVGLTHLVSLASGTSVRLSAGTNNIGDVDIASAIPAGGNYIGLTTTTVANTVTVQASNLEIRGISSGTDSIAAVQSGTWNVGLTHLTSLASGTKVGLDAGTNFIGGVSIFGAINLSQVTLNPSPNFIGLVTVGNTPAVTQSGSWNVGVTGLVSLASGTKVGLDTGTNFIGGVSIYGAINLSQVTLNPSPNFIGLATVVPGTAFPVTDNGGTLTVDGTVAATQSGTWTVGLNHLTSLASGTKVGLNPGSDFIGLATVVVGNTPAVSQSGTWSVGLTHLTSLASGTMVGLNAGSNFIGGVSIFGAINLSQVTLNRSPNFIGLVTVGNTPAVTQSGTWNVGVNGLISLASGTKIGLDTGSNFIGGVSIFGAINLSQVTLNPSPNFIGLATVIAGSAFPITDNAGSITVDGITRTEYTEGDVDTTITGTAILWEGSSNTLRPVSATTPLPIKIEDVGVAIDTELPTAAALADNTANPTVPAVGSFLMAYDGTNWDRVRSSSGILSTSIDNVSADVPITLDGEAVVLGAGTAAFGKLATNDGVDIGDVTLTAGTNFVGLATTVVGNTPLVSLASGFGPMLPISTYTSLATVISAAGNATLFVPPSGQRWILKNLRIAAQGRGEVEIKSGTAVVMPPMSLATTSGITEYYGDSGFRAKAVDQAFVVNILSAATISVMTNVRFE